MIQLTLFPETGEPKPKGLLGGSHHDIPVLKLGGSLPDIQFRTDFPEFTLKWLQALAKAALGLAGEIERAQAERTEP